MSRDYTSLSAELRAGWSEDALRVHGVVAEELSAEVAARKAVGAAVSDARKAARLTQAELASAASMQQAEISRIERGHANPAVSTLARIGAAMGSRLELVRPQLWRTPAREFNPTAPSDCGTKPSGLHCEEQWPM